MAEAEPSTSTGTAGTGWREDETSKPGQGASLAGLNSPNSGPIAQFGAQLARFCRQRIAEHIGGYSRNLFVVTITMCDGGFGPCFGNRRDLF